MADARDHWQGVYAAREPTEVSWYEPVPAVSLELIEASGVARDAGIVDVGGGASTLAAELARAGYTDVAVADISAEALARARGELASAGAIRFVEADVTDHDFGRRFELWHDRALLHFMVEESDRSGYVATLRRSLAPGGHAVIAAFAPAGPEQCSGLPVRRYAAEEVAVTLGEGFELVESRAHEHRTPAGSAQAFTYSLLRRTR